MLNSLLYYKRKTYFLYTHRQGPWLITGPLSITSLTISSHTAESENKPSQTQTTKKK